MANPLHVLITNRQSISTVTKVEEPDKLKAVASAIKACQLRGLKFVVEDITRVDGEGNDFEGRFAKFCEEGDGVMIVADALMVFGKDNRFAARIRNIAAPIKSLLVQVGAQPRDSKSDNCPRLILLEQIGVATPQIISRDIEYVRAETPTRAEVSMELDLFIKDHKEKGITLEGNGTEPKEK